MSLGWGRRSHRATKWRDENLATPGRGGVEARSGGSKIDGRRGGEQARLGPEVALHHRCVDARLRRPRPGSWSARRPCAAKGVAGDVGGWCGACPPNAGHPPPGLIRSRGQARLGNSVRGGAFGCIIPAPTRRLPTLVDFYTGSGRNLACACCQQALAFPIEEDSKRCNPADSHPSPRGPAGARAINVLFAAAFITTAAQRVSRTPPPCRPRRGSWPRRRSPREVRAPLQARAPGGFDLRSYPAQGRRPRRRSPAARSTRAQLVAAPRHMRLLIAQAGGHRPPRRLLTSRFTGLAAKTGPAARQWSMWCRRSRTTPLALSPFFTDPLRALSQPGHRRRRPRTCSATAGGLAHRRARRGRGRHRPETPPPASQPASPALATTWRWRGIVALFFAGHLGADRGTGGRSFRSIALAVITFLIVGLPVSGGPSDLGPFGPGVPAGAGLRAAAGRRRRRECATPCTSTAATPPDTSGSSPPGPTAGIGTLALVATMRRRPAASSRSPRRADPAPRPSPGTRPHRRTLRPRRSVSSSASTTPGPARHALERAVALLGTRPGALHAVYVDHAAGSDLSGFGHEEMAEARREAAGDVEALVAATATRQASPGPSSAGTDHRPTRSSPRPRTGRPDRHRHRGRPGRSCRPTPHRLGRRSGCCTTRPTRCWSSPTCPARRHFLLGTLTSTLFAVADICAAWVATTTGSWRPAWTRCRPARGR